MKSKSSKACRWWWCLNVALVVLLMNQCHSSRSTVQQNPQPGEKQSEGISAPPSDSGIAPVKGGKEAGRHGVPDQARIDSIKATKTKAKQLREKDQ